MSARTVPLARLKGTLNDDWIAAGHSVAGCGDRLRIDPDPVDGGYGEVRP